MIKAVAAKGMTRSRRCYTPKDLSLGGKKKNQSKRPISEGEAEEFWRRMKLKDYSIVMYLEKTPVKISIWSVLMSSKLHRQALIKALDDTNVPMGTSSDNVTVMINQVIQGHQISYCNNELLLKGCYTTRCCTSLLCAARKS